MWPPALVVAVDVVLMPERIQKKRDKDYSITFCLYLIRNSDINGSKFVCA